MSETNLYVLRIIFGQVTSFLCRLGLISETTIGIALQMTSRTITYAHNRKIVLTLLCSVRAAWSNKTFVFMTAEEERIALKDQPVSHVSGWFSKSP